MAAAVPMLVLALLALLQLLLTSLTGLTNASATLKWSQFSTSIATHFYFLQ